MLFPPPLPTNFDIQQRVIAIFNKRNRKGLCQNARFIFQFNPNIRSSEILVTEQQADNR